MSNLDWFWELTDEEIYNGILYRNQTGYVDNIDKVNDYAWRVGFTKLAYWWAESDGDRTLMKLQFADEIAELATRIASETRIRFLPQQSVDYVVWINTATLDDLKERGIIL